MPVSEQPTNPQARLACRRYAAIDQAADAWDGFVPRDLPHLRAGMLRAVERGGVVQEPAYYLLSWRGRPAAAAVTYALPLDTAAAAPPAFRRLVERVRQRAPRFMWKSLRICGSPISNAESGIHLDPALPATTRREVFRRLVRAVVQSSRLDQTIFFKEFNPREVEAYASELELLGFFANDPWAGTVLEVRWKTFDEYLAALRKRYRKRIRQDFATAEGLDFELRDAFADLAAQVAALYSKVLQRAKFSMEAATEGFFAAVSDFDQAKLLVARERQTGRLAGANLLAFGDTCMHNLYIGFDYELNERHHTYFALVEHSLRIAIERGCQTCYFGQDSYEFKSRLGAKPVPMTAYMKHRVWPVHVMLRATRHAFFPPNQPAEHDVFQEGEGRE